MAKVNLDKVGAVASAICAVHCALTGLALSLLSVVGLGFLGSTASEVGFIGFALVVGLWAIVHGLRKHHSPIPAAVFVLGLGCLSLSHFAFPHTHGSTSHPASLGSTIFAVLGGLSLVSFHALNLRYQKACGDMHCHHSHS